MPAAALRSCIASETSHLDARAAGSVPAMRAAIAFTTLGMLLACSNKGASPAADAPAVIDAEIVIDSAPGAIDAPAGPPDAAVPAPDADVAVFAGAYVYFKGADNHRQIDAPVKLPPAGGRYKSITLDLALTCPASGGCDWWDRHGHLSILQGNQELELLRFVTPYRKPMSVSLDVTDLAPLLAGDATFRVFIDTWVGPGHPNGAGWMVDATLRYRGGTPPSNVVAVVPLWSPQGVVYGDPSRPTKLDTAVDIPAGVTGARLWSFVTGHGQGNADNCAEFCSREHTLTVGATPFKRTIWRTDCATTAVPDQPGTWTLDRAGWCPGAGVRPWIQDVSSAIAGGQSLAIHWAPATYTNTCRQGVPPAQCSGCTLGTGCDYDGGNHTEPNYQVSGLLVLVR
jgi:Peptide-N-glycosidase F, C terminal